MNLKIHWQKYSSLIHNVNKRNINILLVVNLIHTVVSETMKFCNQETHHL